MPRHRKKERAYLEGLKKARAEIFTEQEAARRQALDERGSVQCSRRARQRPKRSIPHASAWRRSKRPRVLNSKRRDRQLAEQIANAVLSGEVQ